MIVFDMTISFDGFPRSLRRQGQSWPKIKKEVYFKAGKFWHRELKPKHFTKAGAREYNYTPRSGEGGSGGSRKFFSSYTGRKQRRHGHQLPLVWSGTLRRESSVDPVTATSKGARAIIKGRVLNVRLRNSRINMRREITAVSNRDARLVVQDAGKRLNKLISKTRSARATIKV